MQMTSLSPETLAPIRKRFIDALRDREPRVGAAAETAQVCEPNQLIEDIHKIRGVAPMLGMAELGALAAQAEDRLEPWLAAATITPPGMMPDDLQTSLKDLHDAIRQALG